MTKTDFSRQARQTAFITVALVAAFVFGIIVLADGDWVPGVIIVAATIIGLAGQIPVIGKLCRERPASSLPRNKPTS